VHTDDKHMNKQTKYRIHNHVQDDQG